MAAETRDRPVCAPRPSLRLRQSRFLLMLSEIRDLVFTHADGQNTIQSWIYDLDTAGNITRIVDQDNDA